MASIYIINNFLYGQHNFGTFMGATIHLANSQTAVCHLKSLLGGSTYASCYIEKNSKPTTSKSIEVFRGSRPAVCEQPGMADSSPMATCAYRFHDLSRCGCSPLDPNHNPELWHAYIEAVKKAILSRLHQDKITVTIFASGYLLQDSELLHRLFKDEAIQAWQGTLKLQFVDLKYALNSIEHQSNNLLPLALVFGVLGVACLVYAATTEKKELKNYILVAGMVALIGALFLGKSSWKASSCQVKDPVMKTIDQFMATIEQHNPMTLQTDFFPNVETCINQSTHCDVVIGYDIDDTLDFFEELRKRHLVNNGEAVLVTKQRTPSQHIVKAIQQAWGPQGDYEYQIFK